MCECVQPAISFNMKTVLFDLLFLIMPLQRLCSAHFEPTQFINDDMERLIWKAIPTLFGDRKPVVRLHSNQSTQVRTLSRCYVPHCQRESTVVSFQKPSNFISQLACEFIERLLSVV